MKNRLLLRLFVVVAAMMCALGASAAEAYACYTSSNTTLSFYYDNQRSSRTGTTYDLNTGTEYPGWSSNYFNVTKVVFDPSFANARPTTTYRWFNGMMNLESITSMNYLNTSEVTMMSYMFRGCSNLTSLDLSSFNTQNVTDMSYMFRGCSGLTSLDLSSFNTQNVTNMSCMFLGCSSLTAIYVESSWSTENVTSSVSMFFGCTSLVGGQGTTYDENHIDVTYAHIDGGPSNPGYFSGDPNAPMPPTPYTCYTSSNTTLTFYYDNQRSSRTGTTYSLNTGTNYPGWKTDSANVNVTKVVFDPSFAGARPTTTFGWFYNMVNLQSITGISYLNTSEVTNMGWMFDKCQKLASLDLSNFNTTKVTKMGAMFQFCESLTSLDLSSFNTANVTDMNSMFNVCSGLTSLDLSSFNTANVTDMHYMFKACSHLASIYVRDNWTTAAVTASSNMFLNCRRLVGGQGTAYDENQVDKTYAHIDGGPSNPGYLTESNTPTAYACYTSSNTTLTFYYDNQRSSRTGTTYILNTGINFPGWKSDGIIASVTRVVFDPSFASARPTTTYMWFEHMQNLTEITGISYLNTNEVTNMGFMFNDCSGLNRLDLSGFNTSEVTDMRYMFYGCSNLTSLDLSSFNTAKVTRMDYMFKSCNKLQTIYVGNGWSTEVVLDSEDMFYGCTSLVGGQGTTYNSDHTNKAYAHIDGGTSYPGYFSDANGPRPYACYARSNGTLTFYCDKKRSSRPGTTYDLNIGDNDPDWYNDGTYAIVAKVVFDPSFADAHPTTTYNWFGEMEHVVSISGINYLNTSEVTNMAFMFYGCTGMRSLDVSGFNTSKVTDMSSMFKFCNSLTSLDLSSFNTALVTDMKMMFQNCLNLKTIFVGSEWSTAAVTSSADMFLRSTTLVGGQGTTYNGYHVDASYAHIDGGTSDPGYLTDIQIAMQPYAALSSDSRTLTFYKDGMITAHTEPTFLLNEPDQTPGWSTYCNIITTVAFDPSFAPARPTYMGDWFNGMSNLTSITGMEYLNTSQVTSMHSLFNGCSSLASVDLSNFDTGNVTDMNSMFRDCAALQSLAVSSFDTRNVTDMNAMFRGCTGLTELDLSSFNTANVTKMIWMFYKCTNLTTITVGTDWNTSNVTTSANMFGDCTSLVGGRGTAYSDSNPKDKTYAHVDGGTSDPGYFTADPNAPMPYACYTPSNTTLTFYCDNQRSSRPGTTYDLNEGENNPDWRTDGNYANITTVVFDESFAEARPTSTNAWFAGMSDLTEIVDVENLDTRDVTTMKNMFHSCSGLTSLDLSHFNTQNVTSMRTMFYQCSNLTSLDLSAFNTQNVTNMYFMFGYCSGLTDLDLSGFDTQNVTDMSFMFAYCSGLTNIDMGNFNTQDVTTMRCMFNGCTNLTSLDLTGFDTQNVTDLGWMFENCNSLTSIFVKEDWNTANVTTSKNMFNNCSNLVGGQGTTYDANHVDKAYAHIDGGISNPGYFSEKPKEAYACYTSSNTTLTFYYDNQRYSRTGTTYNLNTGYNDTGWDTDGTNYNVTKVVFDPSFAGARPTTTYDWFYLMSKLQSITGIEYLNTSEVTNMAYMFTYCESLTSLDLGSFNTSKVNSMYNMFYDCDYLQTIYVGNDWSTAAVTESSDMFTNCFNLVGGKGTTYDANHIDKTYAHIDGGPSNPGYFSVKGSFLRGDVNGDGDVNISDVIDLINYLLNDSGDINLDAANFNEDSGVNISDAIDLINYLLNNV